MKSQLLTQLCWFALAWAWTSTTATLSAEEPKALHAPYRSIGEVERLDPHLNDLLPENASLEVIAEGFEWSEGPVWNHRENFLLFSDIPRNTIFQWIEGEPLSVYLQPSGFSGEKFSGTEPGSNGLIYDDRGRLIICQHGDRRIVRQEINGDLTPIATTYNDHRLNSPNDVVRKNSPPSAGAYYFTDPPYGLPGKNEDPDKELNFNGVFRRATNGMLTLLTDQITYPNGIGFSPDESTLYVACSDPEKPVWYRFQVDSEGKLDSGTILFDATSLQKQGRQGLPDGMTVDVHGNLWATGPGGVLVLTPDGKHLGTLLTGQATANCTFGNEGDVLYITADMYLCRIQTSTRGLGFQP